MPNILLPDYAFGFLLAVLALLSIQLIIITRWMQRIDHYIRTLGMDAGNQHWENNAHYHNILGFMREVISKVKKGNKDQQEIKTRLTYSRRRELKTLKLLERK